jgi:membrane-bound lytic murein transglycosylase D
VRGVAGVLLVAMVAAPGAVFAWGGDPLPPARSTGTRLALLPPPPEMPPPPGIGVFGPPGLELGVEPDPEQGAVVPDPLSVEEPEEPDGAAIASLLEDPLLEDVRTDVVVALAPEGPYPIVVNTLVESLIDYFTARERERFGLWIARSGRYLGMIQRILRARGLPEELAYTAMIESGFSPRAVSRVGARGMWQFMEATGRRYGLTVNRWVDERHDPVKSTIAAARYLGDLYGMFGHWFLAQAAYNAGEARIARAIQRARTTDFWALTQTRHLPEETKLFVPQILAATVITRSPARYGFDVAMEAPLEFDGVKVRRALDFETIAALAGVPVEAIRDLNPALRAGITPPFGTYEVRLPAGAGRRFEAALATATGVTSWVVHQVGRNQSLADIARLYGVHPQRLAAVNQLQGGRLRGVTELLVPVAQGAEPRGDSVDRRVARAGGPPAGEVIVRAGDTLWAIASRHGVTPQALARVNGRDLAQPIHPGDRLRLP